MPAIRTLRHPAQLLAILVLAASTGCATLFPPPLALGDSESQVLDKWGQPAARYRAGGVETLAYPIGAFNQRTWMVRMVPGKGVVSVEQVLTDKKFATIQTGRTTQDEVLRTFGPPYETSHLPLKDYEVWTYAYKEAGAWDSLMHIHFDRSGTVQMMLTTPDPRFDEQWPGLFGLRAAG